MSNIFQIKNSKLLYISCINQLKENEKETLTSLQLSDKVMKIRLNISNNKKIPANSNNFKEKQKKVLSDNIEIELINENEHLKKENMKLNLEFNKDKDIKIDNKERGNINNNLNRKDEERNKSEFKIECLKKERIEIENWISITERQNKNIENENMIIENKINSLEDAFVGGSIIKNSDGSVGNYIGKDYTKMSIQLENEDILNRIDSLNEEISQLNDVILKLDMNSKKKRDFNSCLNGEFQENQLREYNLKLSRQVEFLQKRERELLEKIMIMKSIN